jgi:hypothetical protein
MPTTARNARLKKKMFVFDSIPNASELLQRDGCPKIVNLGSSRTDMFYERKKFGMKAPEE